MAHTKDIIKFESSDERINKLSDLLNVCTNSNDKDPEGSIMQYGQLCNHDDAFMCEHRLKYILDFVVKNFK